MQAVADRSVISDDLRSRFDRAQRVLVLTGAGVSAESGVPTFRGGGNTAVWKGMPFRRHFIRRDAGTRSARSVEWFNYRRGVLRTLQPNPAHNAIARWQESLRRIHSRDSERRWVTRCRGLPKRG
jgi:NAD-dependent SIR2 family protein deacetylase